MFDLFLGGSQRNQTYKKCGRACHVAVPARVQGGNPRQAATADKQAMQKAAPAKKLAPKPDDAYVDGNGVRTKNAPASWPFGTAPPPKPPLKEDLPG